MEKIIPNNIEFINGNILDSEDDMICHQVNCKAVMGAGLAKQIANKFKNVFNEYKAKCAMYSFNSNNLLGSCDFVECKSNNGNKLIITNLYGQNDIGIKVRQTNYEFLYQSLEKMFNYLNEQSILYNRPYNVGIPYKLGCGLAGGNWHIVYAMIESFAISYPNISIKIYKYEDSNIY